MGTGTQRQLEQLLTINCKGFVLALDGDTAGRRGDKKIAEFLRSHRKDVFIYCTPDDKDINDMTEDEFRYFEVKTYPEWLNLMQTRFNREELFGEI